MAGFENTRDDPFPVYTNDLRCSCMFAGYAHLPLQEGPRLMRDPVPDLSGPDRHVAGYQWEPTGTVAL